MNRDHPVASDAIQRIEEKADRSFPSIAAARRLTDATMERLRGLLHDQDPSDTSIVVFGSLARGEYTAGSDVDWTLLIDGQADPAHYEAVRSINDTLKLGGFHEPGPTGVFGNTAWSHPILHQIGGPDDTNKLTTQRILLLLEAAAVGRDEALERVIKRVIARYVEDDRGLLYARKRAIVPRFLLNDIVRYWRMLAVDFVHKQRDRSRGWALRNAKLRMSRKLIYVSGLLLCFSPELDGGEQRWTVEGSKLEIPPLVAFLRDGARVYPLDHLALAALRPSITPATASALFEQYDAFLGILADQEKRDHLKNLTFDDLDRGDDLFRETSRIGRRFQEALDQLFFVEDPQLRRLIIDYGVF